MLEGKIALDVECNPLQGEELERIVKAVHEGTEYNKYTYVKEKAFALDDTVTTVKLDDEEYEITILDQNLLDRREY